MSSVHVISGNNRYLKRQGYMPGDDAIAASCQRNASIFHPVSAIISTAYEHFQ